MAANVKIMASIAICLLILFIFVGLRENGFSFDIKFVQNFLGIMAIFLPPIAFLFLSDKGYRISYDDEAVYLRPDGLTLRLSFHPERVMRYDDIDVVAGDPGKLINFGIMPFEFIRLYRKNWDGAELFMISPFFLHHDEMKALIQLIHDKRPETFSQDVLDYLVSDRRL